MIVTVFSKTKQTKEGKKFTAYIGRLVKKDGTEMTAGVHFKDIDAPKTCPCCINVEKKNANMQHRDYVREDTGEMSTTYDLWITAWAPGPEYVDHSLDDFE